MQDIISQSEDVSGIIKQILHLILAKWGSAAVRSLARCNNNRSTPGSGQCGSVPVDRLPFLRTARRCTYCLRERLAAPARERCGGKNTHQISLKKPLHFPVQNIIFEGKRKLRKEKFRVTISISSESV